MKAFGVSLVVNTFNAPHSLERVFQGIALQSVPPHQVLVADDGSGPETEALVAAWRSKLPCPLEHVWQPHEGFRRSGVLNRAVLRVKEAYVVFLDGDCPPHRRFIEDHLALAEPGAWVQGRRCFVKEPHVPAFLPGKISVPGWVLSGRIEQGLKAFRTPWCSIKRDRDLRGIIGCNIAMWRDDLFAVNGYDESFVGWGREDSDLGARLYHLGRVRKLVRGRAVVFHLNHPILSRANLEDNQARLEETLRTRRVRAVSGLAERAAQDALSVLE